MGQCLCVCVRAGMCTYDGACIIYMCDGVCDGEYKGLFFAHE